MSRVVVDAAGLIADALVRVDELSADVRKAVLFGVARVQTIVAPKQASIALQEGWAVSHGLSKNYHANFEYLTRLATAAVAPELLTELGPPSDHPLLRRNASDQFRVMREHGHIAYLRTFILQDPALKDISFDGIQDLIGRTDNTEERQLLLRRGCDV